MSYEEKIQFSLFIKESGARMHMSTNLWNEI